MASSTTTQHGATANRRRSSSGGARRASSRRDSGRPARPARTRSVRETPPARRGFHVPTRRLLAALALASVAFTIWSFYPVARVHYVEEREHARLHAELESIQARNARLSKQVARLRTPEGVEDEARETLGLVKQGEHPVVVLDTNADPAASTVSKVPEVDTEEPASAPRGPWTPVLDLVFGVHE